MYVSDFKSIRIKLASSGEILKWSHGEVIKAETINYRTQKPEKDGLFCEKIFGPTKDYECYCGKYKGIRYKGIICDRCQVEVTRSSVRRERMGHISLASPCSHIWFLRGMPSRIGMVLDIPMLQLEKIIYFAAYIIKKVNEEAKKKILEEIEKEYKNKVKSQKSKVKSKEVVKKALEELRIARDRTKEEVLLIKPLKVLAETEYRELSLKYGEIFEAGTGAETLRNIFKEINLKKEIEKLEKDLKETKPVSYKKTLIRLRFFRAMEKAGIRPEWMFLEILPVLPSDLRPMVQLDGGRYVSSDLNDLYRRVINRNNRLKYLLEISAPEVIIRNEKRMLQEAVDALLDNGMRKGQTTTATTGGRRLLKSLADILKGKQGRFRKNLLGKRVDYSGRSVVAVGPELLFSQCGIPKILALEIFKPFVIKKLLDSELAYNIRGATKLIEEGTPEVFAALEEVVADKLVLLNRAPTLHRLGIQAFKPILIEGEAIKIHPLVCRAFNADFDGDQMAVHVPLSEEAQKEAKTLMFSVKNLLKPATGTPIIVPQQDIVLGCYLLTQIKENEKGEGKIFSSPEEVILNYELGKISLGAKIKIPENTLKRSETFKFNKLKLIETNCGRIIFNSILPDDYQYLNLVVDSKILSQIITDLMGKHSEEEVVEILDRIKELGFEYSTLSGISLGMDDLIVPKGKKELIEKAEKEIDVIENYFKKEFLTLEEKRSKTIGVWQQTKQKVEKLVYETLPKDGPVHSIVSSGARGGWVQLIQMVGMKGLVINPAGKIIELPIKHCYKEGFDVLEYFISTHGGRKGTVDTALRTSASGYLTRRLVDVANEVIISEEDCADKEGTILYRSDAEEIGQDFTFELVSRISLEDIKGIIKKNETIDREKAKKINQTQIKQIRVRSPLSCKATRGICQKCYGWEMGRNKLANIGDAVGVVAAQSIGEPGTQLTMRTFHYGGVAGGGDITQGLPRVEEIFELREPKGLAQMSEIDGKVEDIDNKNRIIKISFKENDKKKIVEYEIPQGVAIWVKNGEKIKKGQQLCEGNLDLKKLYKTKGKEETQRYIIKEVQKIYIAEGVDIHRKHIETIANQMFSRIRIKDGGDSFWLPGQIVTRTEFEETKKELKLQDKNPPKGIPVFLGISKIALTSASFLAAASFQETSRVLIKAALEGREDKLYSLKENVILGKLIPAGTGYKKHG